MKVCLIQMNSCDDKTANLAQAKRLLDRAITDTEPDLVSIPEMFTYLGGTVAGARESSETVPDGPACEFLRGIAVQYGIHVHGGSLNERDGDRFYNTTLVFDPRGNILARYRKIHLFDVVTPDGKEFKESATYTGGRDAVTFDIDGVTFGCSICYDLRFAELYTKLAGVGAQVIFAPSAFTLMTGKDHWEVLCRARAIETQCYLLAANQTGPYIEEGVDRHSFGNSMIVDPWGTVISRCQYGIGYCAATLDFDVQEKIRTDLPALKNRVLV